MSPSGSAPCYQVHGLNIRSVLPLPGQRLPEELPVDASVELAPIASDLPGGTNFGPLIQAAPGVLQLSLRGIARYRVSRDRIEVSLLEGSGDDATLFLLKCAIPAMMLLRGTLPLMATAVRVGEGTTILCGHSGWGKSALAGILRLQGYPLLSDGICYVSPGETPSDPVVLRPGLPHFSLWFDAMSVLGETMRPAALVRKGVDAPFIYNVEMPEFVAQSVPVRRILITSWDNPAEESIPVADPAAALTGFAILSQCADALGCGDSLRETVAAICGQCPVATFEVTWGMLTRELLEERARRFVRCCA